MLLILFYYKFSHKCNLFGRNLLRSLSLSLFSHRLRLSSLFVTSFRRNNNSPSLVRLCSATAVLKKYIDIVFEQVSMSYDVSLLSLLFMFEKFSKHIQCTTACSIVAFCSLSITLDEIRVISNVCKGSKYSCYRNIFLEGWFCDTSRAQVARNYTLENCFEYYPNCSDVIVRDDLFE